MGTFPGKSLPIPMTRTTGAVLGPVRSQFLQTCHQVDDVFRYISGPDIRIVIMTAEPMSVKGTRRRKEFISQFPSDWNGSSRSESSLINSPHFFPVGGVGDAVPLLLSADFLPLLAHFTDELLTAACMCHNRFYGGDELELPALTPGQRPGILWLSGLAGGAPVGRASAWRGRLRCRYGR